MRTTPRPKVFSSVPGKSQIIQSRLDELGQTLAEIRRNMEALVAENHRLKEIVRLAEAELRNRRDQVQKMETELQASDHLRLEVQARVANTIEKINGLLTVEGRI